jgi:hypothetical protein
MFIRIAQSVAAVLVTLGLAGLAFAQEMSSADLQRLEASTNAAAADIASLRQRDPARARTLQDELDEIRDEVTYLQVKLRKERTVSRSEYTDVRDRLDDLRARARGDAESGEYAAPSPVTGEIGAPTRPPVTKSGTLPVGTEFDVRLQTALSSDTAQVEDRFQATTLVDIRQDGRLLVPAGSTVRGIVTDVKEAGRVDRKGSLTLSFDQITINGRSYPMRGTITQALESGGYKDDVGKIGAGAAVGGIIGGILGGLRGALAGILIGGGGVVAATEGQDVELPPGTVLRVRLDQPLSLL